MCLSVVLKKKLWLQGDPAFIAYDSVDPGNKKFLQTGFTSERCFCCSEHFLLFKLYFGV